MPFDGTTYLPVVELLAEGRRKIEAGWCQGKIRERGAVCMMGALRSQNFATIKAAEARLRKVILRAGFARGIVEFNDFPGRTKGQVLAIFDAAIALTVA